MAKRRRQNRRKRTARTLMQMRRRTDIWQSTGKLAGLIASTTIAVLGQAELIGEPIRHYVTIIAIGSTGACAYLLGPENLKLIMAKVRKHG